jgi:TRAP transporter 4TM/12TM fusion protein
MKIRNIREGFVKKVLITVCIILSLFHLYTAGFGLLPPMQQRVFHLAFILFLVFLLFPATTRSPKDRVPWYDIILAIAALASNFYIFFVFDYVAFRFDISISFTNFLIGMVALLLIIEATRRAVGKELVILCVISILYMLFGYLFPGFLRYRGMGLVRLVEYMAWSTDGPYGIVLQVSATYIFTFIYFGVLISKTGIGELFNDLAVAIFGRTRGGGAKVSVFASGLMGTISGIAVANVATTGSFTIPLMKKSGYSPTFAAAVEAVSSTGGQIMPPIMGASAFIMAGILGIPYVYVIKAAVIPALLYYFAVFLAVDLRALAIGLKGLKKEDLPSIKKALRERGLMLIPVILLVALLIRGFSPLFCVFYSIVATLVISAFNKKTRISLKDFMNSLIEGAQKALSVATACAVVGFTVGMIGATGLGMALGDGIISLAGDNSFICLILIAIVSLILGTGLPPTACYIVVAVIAAPILIRLLEIRPLMAHLFVYYYGMLAVITPPVALASFTAAGLVGESPYKVGWEAFKLGAPAYVIPFVFITSPALMLFDVTIEGILFGLFRGIIMVVAIAASLQGFIFDKIGYFSRIPLFISAILIMYSSTWSNIAGIIIALAVLFIHFLKMKSITNFQKE